jgi:uncharacterized membrane protein YgcG
MGVFAELWFLSIPAVLVAFVVFVILNSIFNPKPGPTVRGSASVSPDAGSSTGSSDSFYFITDSVGSSAGSSDGTGSGGDFDSGSGSGGGGGDAGGGGSDSGSSSSD